MIKKIDIDIWKYMMDNRNEEVYLQDLRLELEMTDRQIMSRISRAGLPYIQKISKDPVVYKMVCGIEEAEEATVRLLSKHLGYPEEDIHELVSNVSDVGMMSLDMIDYNQEISRRDASYILHTCPVIQVSKGVKNNYIRVVE